MNELKQLYQKLLKIDDKDMYKLETDFFMILYNDYFENIENGLPWVTAFLTISTWFGTSMRSGSWTFYEVGNMQQIESTLQYLKSSGDDELASIFAKGIHDYQNSVYAENYNYPETWLEESVEIDEWIWEHEDWLWKWEYDILIKNRDSILNG